MPEAHDPGERASAQRETDHGSLARLSDTLVPALVQKLNASGLGELEVREGDWRIRLRRPAGSAATTTPARRDRPRLAAHPIEREPRVAREAAPASDPRAVGAGGAAPAAGDRERATASSPAVGVFRPGALVGAEVRVGDRVAIVDLLGIPQDVVAPIDGRLVEVLVEVGEAVEYGEALAIVEAIPVAQPGDDAAAGEG